MTDSLETSAGASIREIVEELRVGAVITKEQRLEKLRLLSDYECWLPFLKLLNSPLTPENLLTESEQLDSCIEAMRVYNIHLNQPTEAIKICRKSLADFSLTFEQFQVRILSQVIQDGNYLQEVYFLKKISDHFPRPECRILCLEHIAVLYDKRIHNENALAEVYEKILSKDPKNVRALRYFKVLYTQSGAFEDVVRVLKMLLLSVQYPEERYRVAQELAAVLLYQMQEPLQAIQLLDRYCAQSPLDSSTIQYDAYASMKDWQGCLNVLKSCLDTVKDDHQKAILWYRIGKLSLQLSQKQEALDAFSAASEQWPQFLEPLEEMVYLHTYDKDWELSKSVLLQLATRVRGEEHLKKIQQLIKIVAGELKSGV